jgi:hypothetical protein
MNHHAQQKLLKDIFFYFTLRINCENLALTVKDLLIVYLLMSPHCCCLSLA